MNLHKYKTKIDILKLNDLSLFVSKLSKNSIYQKLIQESINLIKQMIYLYQVRK